MIFYAGRYQKMKILPVAWLTTETVRKHRALIIFTSKVSYQR